MSFKGTKYHLESLCCRKKIEDTGVCLRCPGDEIPALLRAIYDVKQINIDNGLKGIYKFADWLPIQRLLRGSASPVTYKSTSLAKHLGLTNLYVTFSGFWPEKGAFMKSGSFKECEAFSVCARMPFDSGKTLVVASAGNTARAFARICSDNEIPVVIVIPEDNIKALWFDSPLRDCVKIIASAKGSDYFDAIFLSNVICQMNGFMAEGGAFNVARRDGMGTTVLSAATTIGSIPEYYFQAVGSGTGAIAAWEANLRLLEDGRFGSTKMKLMLSQNLPFVPMAEAWDNHSRTLPPMTDQEARDMVEIIDAKVLSNRRPPYSLKGGLYDAMCDAGGAFYRVTNEKAKEAAQLFENLEGNDVDIAASVAVASLIEAVEKGDVDKDAIIMLNITGGGGNRLKQSCVPYFKKPDLVFSIEATEAEVHAGVEKMIIDSLTYHI